MAKTHQGKKKMQIIFFFLILFEIRNDSVYFFFKETLKILNGITISATLNFYCHNFKYFKFCFV